MLDNIRKETDKHFNFTEDKILQAANLLDIKSFPTDTTKILGELTITRGY